MNIKQEYPKSYKEIKIWLKPKLIFILQNIVKIVEGDTIPSEPDDETIDQFTELTIGNNRRILYDFFDDKKIFISMGYTWENRFIPNIEGEDYQEGGNFLHRIDAEESVFNRAFKILENSL